MLEKTNDIQSPSFRKEFLKEARRMSNQNYQRDMQQAKKHISLFIQEGNIENKELISTKSIEIFENALNENLVHGRSIIEMCGASIFLACRYWKEPVSHKEIAHILGINYVKVISFTKLIPKIKKDFRNPHPKDFIPRFCRILECDSWIERNSILLLDFLSPKELHNGTQAETYAACAIYLMCKKYHHKISQSYISDKCYISENAIRKASKIFRMAQKRFLEDE